MNGKHAILSILAASATYNTHIGGSESAARIFYNRAKQGAAYPHTIVRKQSTQPNDTKSGASEQDFDFVQVLHMAETEDKCQQMATAARSVLDRIAEGTYNTLSVIGIQFIDDDDFDDQVEDRDVYTTEQIFKVMIRR